MKSDREQTIRVVRKKVIKGGHHGGAWKVAFADFMTSMMALFLVLWLITQSSDVRAAIAGYFQDPMGRAGEFGPSMIPGEGAPPVATRPMINASMLATGTKRLSQIGADVSAAAALLDANGMAHVEVELTPDGLRISLIEDSTDVFFQSGSARPLERARILLEALAPVLTATDTRLEIEGHTDAKLFPAGSSYSNWELSADRANAARRLITQGGFPEAQVVAVRGLADRIPRIVDDPAAPQNRRVTLLVKITEPAVP